MRSIFARIHWDRLSAFPWHPLLIALYASLELGARNIGQSGYVNQAEFISDRISQVVKGLIENSTVPPIIIIQGDHGPSHYDKKTRMGILNAYYFPDVQSELYSNITPVNSFRLLLNTYFGAEFGLLEDVSYYSEYPYAYQFETIPNLCQTKPQ